MLKYNKVKILFSIKLPYKRCLFTLTSIFSTIIHLFGCDEHGIQDSLKTPLSYPLVMAHRGASGYFPEHTLMAYLIAVQQGADYLEPDLVFTKDGVLIARHENDISLTTNVSTVFPDRKSIKIIDGDTISGWFTEDFTLKEIKQLKAVERLSFRNHEVDGQYEIPTLLEIIALVHQLSDRSMRLIGLVPEIKHSSYFHSLGFHPEDSLLKILSENHLPSFSIPVIIQSFEISNLQYLHSKCNIPLLQLIDDPFKEPYDQQLKNNSLTYKDMLTNEGLTSIAQYAFAIGLPKEWMLFTCTNDSLKTTSPLIKMIHDVGLKVVLYTFRKEVNYIDEKFKGDFKNEIDFFLRLGIDAFFTDFPDIGFERKAVFLLK